MHIEVQVALNFVISYLYNKLPRRRVNIFGEELEKALKDKFQGHWYPDKPFKGSAFRCLKTGDPIDKVLERAARESGVPIQDILENLPQELAVWVDPGEVSYRIGEKGAVKVLFSDKSDPQDENNADREVTKTFNPEAQCFRPIESVGCSLSNLSLSPKSSIAAPFIATAQQPPNAAAIVVGGHQLPTNAIVTAHQGGVNQNLPPNVINNGHLQSPSGAPSPTTMSSYKSSPSPVPSFIPRTTTPLTFTTATFAQTKFGSTKLKTSSKRANRMSPTEFSNYIKQRAMQQQLHQQPPPPQHHSPGGGRALSPDPTAAAYYFGPAGPYGGGPQFAAHHRSMFESSSQQFLSPDLYSAGGKLPGGFEHAVQPTPMGPYYPANNATTAPVTAATTSAAQPGSSAQDNNNKLLDNWTTYPAAGQYQHLLVAN
ncbi:protein Tob1-like [Onthophagus taurus]|uniref:protein Tob1-like n=1 Tax=Onthophagus taurus TaxID=166361 RepID=UPI000C20C215|nr:protein Tob1-like [Onthophagus taurus]XP_022918635.1 protein Tob1-like [Onthophagus taurus]XP_022918636.1 protein Tob1-like [Onthophagus taurus]